MKLTELEPTLDPRRPLHFATMPPSGRSQHFAARRPVVTVPSDLRSVDAVIARLASHAPVADPIPAGHTSSRSADLGVRAAAAVTLFTGAATGLVVALWRDRSDRMEASLRCRLSTARTALVADRSAAEAGDPTDADLAGLRAASTAAQDAWTALADFDALHRAFAGGDVRALSPEIAASFARTPPTAQRAAAAFAGHTTWGDGVTWTPDGIVAWHATVDGVQLFTVPGPELASWVIAPTVTAPTWPTVFLGADTRFDDLPQRWRAIVVMLGRLVALGTQTAGPDGGATVPVTRLLMTAAEARRGLDAVDLSTGSAPSGRAYDRAQYREMFSAAQNRRIRVFVDATWRGNRPPIETVLVTVLPH